MTEDQIKSLLSSSLGDDLNFLHIAERVLIYDRDDEDRVEDYLTYLLLEADVGRSQSATGPQRRAALLRTLEDEK